ncbi:hypothetical protein AGMMS50284_4270 [Clostridia bacterium]|nr:hypothetical protein AGMMS50284_4270 [Clostridia bacterium]
MTKLGALFKYYREKNKLTQAQVAKELKIDRSSYTYYEIGKTMPSIKTIIKLARIFDVPYTVFLECVAKEMLSENESLRKYSKNSMLNKK